MAYQNYVKKKTGSKPNLKPAPHPKGQAINKGIESSVAGGKFKTMTLPGGKPAVLAAPVQGNMDRTTKQPAIKQRNFDTREKGAQQTNSITTGKDPSAATIATKSKDNTVKANIDTKFSPKVNRQVADMTRVKYATKRGGNQIQGSTKTSTDMNYAKSAGKNVDGAGQKTQTSPGPDGAAGSKKVAFAAMKKGTKNKIQTPKTAGVSAAGKGGAIGTAGGDKGGHTSGTKYNWGKKRGKVAAKKEY